MSPLDSASSIMLFPILETAKTTCQHIYAGLFYFHLFSSFLFISTAVHFEEFEFPRSGVFSLAQFILGMLHIRMHIKSWHKSQLLENLRNWHLTFSRSVGSLYFTYWIHITPGRRPQITNCLEKFTFTFSRLFYFTDNWWYNVYISLTYRS